MDFIDNKPEIEDYESFAVLVDLFIICADLQLAMGLSPAFAAEVKFSRFFEFLKAQIGELRTPVLKALSKYLPKSFEAASDLSEHLKGPSGAFGSEEYLFYDFEGDPDPDPALPRRSSQPDLFEQTWFDAMAIKKRVQDGDLTATDILIHLVPLMETSSAFLYAGMLCGELTVDNPDLEDLKPVCRRRDRDLMVVQNLIDLSMLARVNLEMCMGAGFCDKKLQLLERGHFTHGELEPIRLEDDPLQRRHYYYRMVMKRVCRDNLDGTYTLDRQFIEFYYNDVEKWICEGRETVTDAWGEKNIEKVAERDGRKWGDVECDTGSWGSNRYDALDEDGDPDYDPFGGDDDGGMMDRP